MDNNKAWDEVLELLHHIETSTLEDIHQTILNVGLEGNKTLGEVILDKHGEQQLACYPRNYPEQLRAYAHVAATWNAGADTIHEYALGKSGKAPPEEREFAYAIAAIEYERPFLLAAQGEQARLIRNILPLLAT